MPPSALSTRDAPRLRDIAKLWLPLAASWMLMAIEQPLIASTVARLPNERVELAAFGGIAFPVALVIEGPIIMLLAASTALCTHWGAYVRLRRFTHVTSAALTLLHAAVCFTPLYDAVVVPLLDAPPEVQQSGRLALAWMLPWTWAIAARRFQQGVLIRAGRGGVVTQGSAVRLGTDLCSLLLLPRLGLSGAEVAGATLSLGVLAEAAFVGWRVQPVLRELRGTPEPADAVTLSTGGFLRFYVPLALTPLITLLIQPIGSAAMNRMPQALDSLAAWPAVHGVVFLMRSSGMAFNEVVVAQLGTPGAHRVLQRFGRLLALGTVGLLLLASATPLAQTFFLEVIGLNPWLAVLATTGVAISTLMPGYQALQSWYQGALVWSRDTRAITEAVVLYLVLCSGLLFLSVRVAQGPGLLWALGSFVLAGCSQTAWLAWRSRGARAAAAAL